MAYKWGDEIARLGRFCVVRAPGGYEIVEIETGMVFYDNIESVWEAKQWLKKINSDLKHLGYTPAELLNYYEEEGTFIEWPTLMCPYSEEDQSLERVFEDERELKKDESRYLKEKSIIEDMDVKALDRSQKLELAGMVREMRQQNKDDLDLENIDIDGLDGSQKSDLARLLREVKEE